MLTQAIMQMGANVPYQPWDFILAPDQHDPIARVYGANGFSRMSGNALTNHVYPYDHAPPSAPILIDWTLYFLGNDMSLMDGGTWPALLASIMQRDPEAASHIVESAKEVKGPVNEYGGTRRSMIRRINRVCQGIA